MIVIGSIEVNPFILGVSSNIDSFARQPQISWRKKVDRWWIVLGLSPRARYSREECVCSWLIPGTASGASEKQYIPISS